jgi:VanZ family protein
VGGRHHKRISLEPLAAGLLRLTNSGAFRRAIGPLCLLLVSATLTAGLWPFCVPRNQVTWIPGENGLRFGEHGTALSWSTLPVLHRNTGCSLELWVKPAMVWTTGTVLTLYNPQSRREFSIEQDLTGLVLRVQIGRGHGVEAQKQLWVRDVFRKQHPFITVASDGVKTTIYLDGQLATVAQGFGLSSEDLAGQVILANSAFNDNSWQGEVNGLAIYRKELNSTEAQREYGSWVDNGGPAPEQAEGAVALYTFREHSGNVVSNTISSQTNLHIPRQFLVVDKLRFESPWSELHGKGSYLNNAIINIAGLVPLGFILGVYFTQVRPVRRATLVTVIIGATVSLAIEYFQSFLPTRYSGVTDLITNTAGAWIGVTLSMRWASLARSLLARGSGEQPSP